MKKVKCTHSFSVPKYDDNGFMKENINIEIKTGSIWEIDDDSYKFIGGEVRLLHDTDWIEISKETFKNYFEEVNLNIGTIGFVGQGRTTLPSVILTILSKYARAEISKGVKDK